MMDAYLSTLDIPTAEKKWGKAWTRHFSTYSALAVASEALIIGAKITPDVPDSTHHVAGLGHLHCKAAKTLPALSFFYQSTAAKAVDPPH
jgi:hypothetical protein